MPTGFNKFSAKVLDESPINLGQNTPASSEKEAAPAPKPTRVGRVVEQTPAEAAPVVVEPVHKVEAKEPSLKRKKEEMADLVYISIRVPKETKRLMDEMKYRSGRNIWELTDEAIRDLYKKLYR